MIHWPRCICAQSHRWLLAFITDLFSSCVASVVCPCYTVVVTDITMITYNRNIMNCPLLLWCQSASPILVQCNLHKMWQISLISWGCQKRANGEVIDTKLAISLQVTWNIFDVTDRFSHVDSVSPDTMSCVLQYLEMIYPNSSINFEPLNAKFCIRPNCLQHRHSHEWKN